MLRVTTWFSSFCVKILLSPKIKGEEHCLIFRSFSPPISNLKIRPRLFLCFRNSKWYISAHTLSFSLPLKILESHQFLNSSTFPPYSYTMDWKNKKERERRIFKTMHSEWLFFDLFEYFSTIFSAARAMVSCQEIPSFSHKSGPQTVILATRKPQVYFAPKKRYFFYQNRKTDVGGSSKTFGRIMSTWWEICINLR